MTNFSDFLYSTVDVAIWSCSETGISITASCAATLKPLFNKLFASHSSRHLGSTARISPIPLSFEEEGHAHGQGFRGRFAANGKRRYVRTTSTDVNGDEDGDGEELEGSTVREGTSDGGEAGVFEYTGEYRRTVNGSGMEKSQKSQIGTTVQQQ